MRVWLCIICINNYCLIDDDVYGRILEIRFCLLKYM